MVERLQNRLVKWFKKSKQQNETNRSDHQTDEEFQANRIENLLFRKGLFFLLVYSVAKEGQQEYKKNTRPISTY